MKIVNANHFSINPAVVNVAYAKSGLRWAISLAQHVALLNLALISPVEIRTTVSGDQAEKLTSVLPSMNTLGGIPFSIEDNVPAGTIELRLETETLVRVEHLGVPMGMEINA